MGVARVGGLIWLALLGFALFGLVAATSGIASTALFNQFSTLKWAMTVGGPLWIIVLLTVRRPSLWSAGLVILTVPIEPYVTTVSRQPVSILFVTSVLATVVVTLEGGVGSLGTRKRSALAAVAPWIVLILIVPALLGTSVAHEVLYVCLFVNIAWICTRVADLYSDGRPRIVLLFLGSAGAQSALALVQHASGHQFSLYGGAGSATYSAQDYFFNYGSAARTTGTFFDPISLGNVLAMALPFALLVVLRREAPAVHRLFAGVMGMLIVGGLTVSLSRASWLAAIAGLLCIPVFSRGEQRRRALALSGSLIVAGVLVASTLYGSVVSTRFASILHPTASTVRTAAGDRTREYDWKVSLGLFEQNPVTGVGIGGLSSRLESLIPGTNASGHAQNTYLQYLAEGGVFGGAALLLLAGGVAADLFRARRADWLYPGLVGSFVTVAVTWVTDYTVRYYAVAGCLAVIVGLAATSSFGTAEVVVPERFPARPDSAMAE